MPDNRSAAGEVADEKQNDRLKHSDTGATTRDDPADLGVTMLQGDASERQGPEDALGVGPKRGDYRARLARRDVEPHETRPARDAKPGEPTVTMEAQIPRAEDIGDAKGLKGGVDTDPLHRR